MSDYWASEARTVVCMVTDNSPRLMGRWKVTDGVDEWYDYPVSINTLYKSKKTIVYRRGVQRVRCGYCGTRTKKLRPDLELYQCGACYRIWRLMDAPEGYVRKEPEFPYLCGNLPHHAAIKSNKN